MLHRGGNCHMAFSPQESPIYGGSRIVVVFSETSDLPSKDATLFLVFQGSMSRHVTTAQRMDLPGTSIEAIIPGHDTFESVSLCCYASQDGSLDLLSEGTLTFVQDSTYYLAHFLASSVCDLSALESPSSIKSDRFDLWQEDMSTLDERLTAAFEHLDLSPMWRLVEDTPKFDQDPPPRETLLHFATRLNLPQFVEYLLNKPGSDVAQKLQNHNGELPVTIARSHGLEDLASRLNEYGHAGSPHHTDDSRVQSKSVTVKRHNIGTATITSNTANAARSLEEDIEMLSELISFIGEEAKSPPSRTKGDPSSPDYFTVGSLPARLPSEMLSSTVTSRQSSQQYFSANDDLDDEVTDGDDDDEEEEEEEDDIGRQVNIPQEQVLEESMAHLHLLNAKVQRLRASNKEYLSMEDIRRESLSRFSSSCPLLADESEKNDIPIQEQVATCYHQDTGNEGAISSGNLIADELLPFHNTGFREAGDESTTAISVEIHVNDASKDDINTSELITSGQLSPSRVDRKSSLGDHLEPLGQIKSRRHSWGPDPTEVVSPTQESEVLEAVHLNLTSRSKSMGNLDIGTEDEFLDARKTLTPKSSKWSLEESPIQGPNAMSSPIDLSDSDHNPMPHDVTMEEKLDQKAYEVDVTSILPPDNTAPLPTKAEIEAVPRRKKNSQDSKRNRTRQTSSMYVTPSSDNSHDSDLHEVQLQQLSTAKQRKARLSLTEFLSDPRNFQEEEAVSTAAAAPMKVEQEGLAHTNRDSIPSSSDIESSRGMSRRFSFLKKTRNKDKKEEKDKKDKDRGKHQFVPVSFSNSTKCDFCDKSMANRDSLQCAVCLINVHNSSCKDHVQGCAKLTKHHKQVSKSVSSLSRDRLSTIIPKSSSSCEFSAVAHSQSMKESTKHRPVSMGHSTHKVQQFPFQGSLTDLRLHGISSSVMSGTIEEGEELEDCSESTSKLASLSSNNISVSMESLDETSAITIEFEEDEDLVSKGTEPESWSVTAEKKVLKKMSHKEIKRQDVIFEFIKTEKHHLRTLKIMQKIFSYGMRNELKMDHTIICRVFPSLEELVNIAVQFNDALQAKQRTGQPVETIGDVLCNQFDKENGRQMMEAYAFMCSRQIDAVAFYKDLYKTDRKFQAFIKKCSNNALCRRWSIPECILSVTNRLTKYPMLIAAIIKPSKGTKVDKNELPNLQKAFQLVKNICQDVNVQVKEYERHQRLMEIYNKLEARSMGFLKSGSKFKKSDILESNRKLRHEGELKWKSARGRLTDIHCVVLTDVVIFLQDNNGKYTFASQDNKPPVINLFKLMVRDVAIDKCSMYLISHKSAPEMYEVNCDTSEKRKKWKEILEQAIHECPDKDAETDEEKRVAEAKTAKIKNLLDQMQQKDNQLSIIMEEKDKLIQELTATLSKDGALGTLRSPVITDCELQMQEAKKILQAAITEAHRLTTAVYSAGAGLTRSASSAGERESSSFQAHSLPKRAETFGGFDNQQGTVVKMRFLVNPKESDARSYSFPNLSKAEEMIHNSNENLHGQQGSDPNLLSVSYQTEIKNQESNDNCNAITVDNISMMSEDVAECALKDAKGALSPDHVVSVNHLLKHLNTLLSISSKKETAYESMRFQLLEANRKIEKLRGVEVPRTITKANCMGPGLPSLPKHSEIERSGRTTTDKSKTDLLDMKGRTLVTGKAAKNEPALISGSKASDQSLRRIAFGDISYNESNAHAGFDVKAESPKSIMKQNAESNSGRQSQDELPSSSEKTVGGRRRDQVPEHLLSATNELQASSGLVHQQLPMKLSSLASLSSSFSNKQMIPSKLSMSPGKSASPTPTRSGNRMFVGSNKSEEPTNYGDKNIQEANQDVLYF